MEPFKNLYSYENCVKISRAFQRVWPDFPREKFLRHLESQLKPLELKDRMRFISQRLSSCLPPDYKTKVDLMIQALRQGEDDKEGLFGFQVWPLTDLIAREGLAHFDISLNALKKMTQQFTAEFDIRPFLIKDQSRTLKLLHRWAEDENEHVRRLVSEGTRPLLPWGSKLTDLQKNPEKTRPLLEKLRLDESAYVRKSVANHLNDHSKVHPEWVLDVLTDWKKTNPDHPGVLWIIRHATRTLIKAGHPRALALQGIRDGKKIVLGQFKIRPRTISIGDSLTWEISVRNPTRKEMNILIDYVVSYRKANGSLRPKVFKGRVMKLPPGETIKLSKQHSFKPVTTRTYFPGPHRIDLKINGRLIPGLPFVLKA